MTAPVIKILETPQEMIAVEALQQIVWPAGDIDVVPVHMLIAAIHNGGVVVGAFVDDQLVGFVYGFPGIEKTPDGPRAKHCSHMLGIHPGFRDSGFGFALKRAQWQIVRHQGLDHITWTYDPLLSRNAKFNISKLGAVCNTYRRNEYGEMRDGLNAGLPSDRFQVDWWINTRRVERRLGKRVREPLKMEHYSGADFHSLYTHLHSKEGLIRPPDHFSPIEGNIVLAEIPTEFEALKAENLTLAREWRFFIQEVFEAAFSSGYLVTDFIRDQDRSFYILSHGDSTL